MSKQRRAHALLPASPLLITESGDEFDRVRDAFDQELKPRGIIEQMYLVDIAYITWEILRLRRCKAAIINSRIRVALVALLKQALRKPGEYALEVEDEADRLASAWSSDPAAKRQVSELLKDFQLDESAIEAEVIRTSAADLELIDRLLASSESRRNRAFRCLADYRGGWGRQLRESSDRIIDGKVLALENAPSEKKPTAAA
jgi:hypothetical protein